MALKILTQSRVEAIFDLSVHFQRTQVLLLSTRSWRYL